MLPAIVPALAYLVGILVGVLLARRYYRKHWAPIPVLPEIHHPSAGRFCHICGADALKNERCDAGLHS